MMVRISTLPDTKVAMRDVQSHCHITTKNSRMSSSRHSLFQHVRRLQVALSQAQRWKIHEWTPLSNFWAFILSEYYIYFWSIWDTLSELNGSGQKNSVDSSEHNSHSQNNIVTSFRMILPLSEWFSCLGRWLGLEAESAPQRLPERGGARGGKGTGEGTLVQMKRRFGGRNILMCWTKADLSHNADSVGGNQSLSEENSHCRKRTVTVGQERSKVRNFSVVMLQRTTGLVWIRYDNWCHIQKIAYLD